MNMRGAGYRTPKSKKKKNIYINIIKKKLSSKRRNPNKTSKPQHAPIECRRCCPCRATASPTSDCCDCVGASCRCQSLRRSTSRLGSATTTALRTCCVAPAPHACASCRPWQTSCCRRRCCSRHSVVVVIVVVVDEQKRKKNGQQQKLKTKFYDKQLIQ